MINNNTPYLRNKIPTLLVFSATAIALLLMSASPLVFSNNILLLQPAQAQTPMTFKTPKPATDTNEGATLTFDIHGTNSSSDQRMNGTFQITDINSGQTLWSGDLHNGKFTNNTNGGSFFALGTFYPSQSGTSQFSTACSTSDVNDIDVDLSNSDGGGATYGFQGPVECSPSQGGAGGDTTTQSTAAGSSQDGDGDRDGIPDSSDNCTHNSNPRCFKEGGDTTSSSTTTTHEQQQPSSTSSSSSSGNQTR